jgi:hypothetical protein
MSCTGCLSSALSFPWNLAIVLIASLLMVLLNNAVIIKPLFVEDGFIRSTAHLRANDTATTIPAVVEQPKWQDEETTNKTKRNAYSFQLAACDPDQKHPAYHFFLAGIYIAIHSLQQSGSKADFFVWIEMIYGSNHTKLPPNEERVLAELGAQIRYLPTRPEQSFYRTQLQKFRILGLVQYQHVWHLDADILPLSNLDFMFDLMDRGILRKNVCFFTTRTVPMNGGTFILSPFPGALREIDDIIQKKEHSVWNETIGFYAADGDQGLLPYWTKYHQKDVSIIRFDGVIEHWAAVKKDDSGDSSFNTTIEFFETEKNAIEKLNDFLLPDAICFDDDPKICNKPRPIRDLAHFTGNRKPWSHGLPSDYGPETYRRTARHYWYSLLDKINRKHSIGWNLTTFRVKEGGAYVKGFALVQSSQGNNQKTFTTLID